MLGFTRAILSYCIYLWVVQRMSEKLVRSINSMWQRCDVSCSGAIKLLSWKVTKQPVTFYFQHVAWSHNKHKPGSVCKYNDNSPHFPRYVHNGENSEVSNLTQTQIKTKTLFRPRLFLLCASASVMTLFHLLWGIFSQSPHCGAQILNNSRRSDYLTIHDGSFLIVSFSGPRMATLHVLWPNPRYLQENNNQNTLV